MIYDVYFNLTKKLYSLRPCEGPMKGRVVGHCTSVSMRDVKFRVSQASRNRVLRDRQKNVHATARGVVTCAKGESFTIEPQENSADLDHLKTQGHKITYCPYRSGSFQRYELDGTLTDIETAESLILDTLGNRYAITP
jgi:hypothetical protein